MAASPEARARADIDRLLAAAGWAVQEFKSADIHAARGVALREFELNPGHGTADYLLYVDGKAAGVIEAKKQGATLTGVEAQSGRYAQGLPASLPAWRRPLPLLYESTGLETHFTSGLDLERRARSGIALGQQEIQLCDCGGQDDHHAQGRRERARVLVRSRPERGLAQTRPPQTLGGSRTPPRERRASFPTGSQ